MIRFLCRNSRVPFEELVANRSGVRPVIEEQFVLPAKRDNGGRLELCPDDVARELEAVFNRPVESGYQYRLVCRRILETMNSAYVDAVQTRKRYPVNWAYMNPLDMQSEGVSDGDVLQIESPHGAIAAIAKGDAGLREKVISMTHLFGELLPASRWDTGSGSNTGRLTSLTRDLQTINFMPRFSGIAVNIKAIAGE